MTVLAMVNFLCMVCGHTAELPVLVYRMLMDHGGDGPYCKECHRTGRGDVRMIVVYPP